MTRRGTTMIELLAAAAILAVLLAICAEMLAVAVGQRRAVEDRQTAICEAGNAMEHVASMPWQRLTDEDVASIGLSAEAQAALPGADLSIEIDRSADQPEAKRVVVVLAWQDRKGRPQRPVRLVAWRWEERDWGERD